MTWGESPLPSGLWFLQSIKGEGWSVGPRVSPCPALVPLCSSEGLKAAFGILSPGAL